MKYLDKNWREIKLWDRCFYTERPYDNYADCIWEIMEIDNDLMFVSKVVRDLSWINFVELEDESPVWLEFHSLHWNKVMDLTIVDEIEFTETYMVNNIDNLLQK